MNKTTLLKEIAVTGYNVIYAAKKHFATYDIVEKAPGWITISTLAIGIFGLIMPAITNQVISAIVTVIGISSIYFNQFQDQRAKYAEAGAALTSHFNRLRVIYRETLSRPESADFSDLEKEYWQTLGESEKVWSHKHIFLSDWYAHYKIFWQAQIEWLDEQLHFSFWRDKIPLTLSITIVLLILTAVVIAVHPAIHVSVTL